MVKLRQLIAESRLDQLNKELKDHVRYYKIAKDANNEWAMEDEKKKIKLLLGAIKQEKAKGPEDLDRDRFLRHHYTGHIGSSAYSQYEKEGGLGWLGNPSKYPVVLERERLGKHTVEFRQTGDDVRYTKTDDKGNIVRDERGDAMYMTKDEIRAAGLHEKDTTIVAFVDGKPVGLASNEFGAVGIWVEGAYQKSGIGTRLLELHLEQRPRVKTGKGKIGQATDAGISLMKAYHRKMAKQHGPEWFKQLSGIDEAKGVLFEELLSEGRLNSITQVTDEVKRKLAAIAQKVYDDWQQDEEGVDDELGTGGICHIIADEMLDILYDHKIYNLTTQCTDQPHVYLVGKFKEGIFTIDIPYYVYESGAAFTWKKKPDVKFDESHVEIYQLDSSYRNWKKYVGDY